MTFFNVYCNGAYKIDSQWSHPNGIKYIVQLQCKQINTVIDKMAVCQSFLIVLSCLFCHKIHRYTYKFCKCFNILIQTWNLCESDNIYIMICFENKLAFVTYLSYQLCFSMLVFDVHFQSMISTETLQTIFTLVSFTLLWVSICQVTSLSESFVTIFTLKKYLLSRLADVILIWN